MSSHDEYQNFMRANGPGGPRRGIAEGDFIADRRAIWTVLLLIWMGFFMMGSLLLLILKHDSPRDSRFIRGLFNVYSMAILVTAAVGALFYALSERPIIALALVCLAGLLFAAR